MRRVIAAKLSDLLGKVLASVQNVDNEELIFTTSEGKIYHLYHDQDCCESVWIESIVGDLVDLVGSPILLAEESTHEDPAHESQTWTFYKFATLKGYVDVRWIGESNGYYSQSVDFCEEMN